MSGALSIFQKACPSCAASVAIDATRCACGHEFDTAGGTGALSAEETALRDEELYENYLAARAGQAAEAARAAADALAEEPGNSDRAAAVELAQEVAKSLEADLNEQRTKIAALRKVLGLRTRARPQPAPAPVVAAAPKPVRPAKPAESKPSGPEARGATPPARAAAVMPRPAAAPPPEPAAVAARPPTPPQAISGPVAAGAAPATPTSLASGHKAAAALEALKRAKAREAAVPAPPPAAVSVTTTPPESFRAEQASRAARALGERPQAVDGKDCPNCTARVPLATARCRCGYSFATSSNELPGLTLCTSDFTALRNNFLRDLNK